MIRVVVVSPVYAVRAGLRALLSPVSRLGPATPVETGIEVVGDVHSLDELDESLKEVDVLVLTAEGISEPELNRLATITDGRQAILLLADTAEAVRMLLKQPLRAWGLLPFDASPDELQAAVHGVHQGLLVVSPVLAQPLLPRLLSGQNEPIEPLIEPLTERETEVLQYLARGLANKQIAVQLGISEHTVKFHVSALYSKLGAANRTEAVRFGVQHGLVVL